MRVRCRGCRWRSRCRWPGRTVRRWEMPLAVRSSSDEHLAVGQQRRRVIAACGVEAAGGSQVPLAGSYSSRSRECRCYYPACNEHLAVGQQRRRVIMACRVEVAGGSPCAGSRVVQFGARESAAGIIPLRRAPCRWAATSPCDYSRAVTRLPVHSRSPSPDRTVPRSRDNAALSDPPATHLASGHQRRRDDIRLDRRGCRRHSEVPLPDRTFPRCESAAAFTSPGRAPCRRATTSPVRFRAAARLPWTRVPLPGDTFRARQMPGDLSSCHEHLAIGQQRRRVT